MTFLPLLAQEQRRISGTRANKRRSIFLMMDFGLGNGEADVGL
jgi:hypothetical protein